MYRTVAHGDEMLLIYNSAVADLCNHNANAGPSVCFLHSDSWLINRLQEYDKLQMCRQPRCCGAGAVLTCSPSRCWCPNSALTGPGVNPAEGGQPKKKSPDRWRGEGVQVMEVQLGLPRTWHYSNRFWEVKVERMLKFQPEKLQRFKTVKRNKSKYTYWRHLKDAKTNQILTIIRK